MSRRWRDLFWAMLWRVRREGVANLLVSPLIGSMTLLALVLALVLVAPQYTNGVVASASFGRSVGYDGHTLAVTMMVFSAPALTGVIVTTAGLRMVRNFAGSEQAVELNELLLAAGVAPADIVRGSFVFLQSVIAATTLLAISGVVLCMFGVAAALGGTLLHVRASYWLMLVLVPLVGSLVGVALCSMISLLRPELVRPARLKLVASFSGGDTVGMLPTLALMTGSLLISAAQIRWLLAGAVLIAVTAIGGCMAVSAALVRPERIV